jgi:uncharacterized membrane protein
MNMIEVESSNLNSFGLAGRVSPSQLVTLTFGQLQDLVQEATERAIEPVLSEFQAVQSRLDALEEVRGRGAGGGEEAIQGLTARVETLEEATARERAYDRQRMARLERVDPPQPLQKDRGEILRALIAANGGKMLATDARKKMHLSRSRFSKLLATAKDEIEARPYHLNKSWQVLVLR